MAIRAPDGANKGGPEFVKRGPEGLSLFKLHRRKPAHFLHHEEQGEG